MDQIVVWAGLVYVIVTHGLYSPVASTGEFNRMHVAIMIIRVSVMFNKPSRTSKILFFLYFLVAASTVVILFLMVGPHSGLTCAYPERILRLCSDFAM